MQIKKKKHERRYCIEHYSWNNDKHTHRLVVGTHPISNGPNTLKNKKRCECVTRFCKCLLQYYLYTSLKCIIKDLNIISLQLICVILVRLQ